MPRRKLDPSQKDERERCKAVVGAGRYDSTVVGRVCKRLAVAVITREREGREPVSFAVCARCLERYQTDGGRIWKVEPLTS